VSPLLAGLRSDPGFTPVLATITSAVAAERARINASGRLPADAKDVTATR
jgi:hypothetical protein